MSFSYSFILSDLFCLSQLGGCYRCGINYFLSHTKGS